MIKGNVVLEDHTIDFTANPDTSSVTVTVTDTFENKSETLTVPMDSFFKALAIAVHPDGAPDYNKDYPAAEQAMGSIRWIP